MPLIPRQIVHRKPARQNTSYSHIPAPEAADLDYARRSTLSKSKHSSEHASTAFHFEYKAAAQLAIVLARQQKTVEAARPRIIDRLLGRSVGQTAMIGLRESSIDLIDRRQTGSDGSDNPLMLLNQEERQYVPAAMTIVDAITKAAGAWQDASEAFEAQKVSHA